MQPLTPLGRQQRAVADLAREPENDRCADCFSRSPRWASYTLGIFLCASCAAVHRRLPSHISKIKSVTLETWDREQVARMREVGNLRSNQYYLPQPRRFPPPTDLDSSERSELDVYIREKYERRAFREP